MRKNSAVMCGVSGSMLVLAEQNKINILRI